MPKSVVAGGARYLALMVFAQLRTTVSSSRDATSTASLSPRSAAAARRCQASRGNLASMGSHTGPESRPGKRIANSTRSPEPVGDTLRSNWPGASICVSRFSSWTSPQAPRVVTFPRMRLRSPTPAARCCISPSPRCTCSRRSLTKRKDSPRRVSRVDCSFSSTVARISSRRFEFSVFRSSSRRSIVSRIFSRSIRCRRSKPELCSAD